MTDAFRDDKRRPTARCSRRQPEERIFRTARKEPRPILRVVTRRRRRVAAPTRSCASTAQAVLAPAAGPAGAVLCMDATLRLLTGSRARARLAAARVNRACSSPQRRPPAKTLFASFSSLRRAFERLLRRRARVAGAVRGSAPFRARAPRDPPSLRVPGASSPSLSRRRPACSGPRATTADHSGLAGTTRARCRLARVDAAACAARSGQRRARAPGRGGSVRGRRNGCGFAGAARAR